MRVPLSKYTKRVTYILVKFYNWTPKEVQNWREQNPEYLYGKWREEVVPSIVVKDINNLK